MSPQNPTMDEEALTDTSDIELLAAVLDRGTATRLMERFGNLRSLLHAESEHLLACAGIGRQRLRTLQVLPELAKRYYSESLPCGESIRSPADTEAFLQAHMRHLDHEVFCCLFLDNRHRVLCFDTLFRGTIDGTSVYPREVVKEALAVNAAAIRAAWQSPARPTNASPGA
jgi:DNA repair protein RadC